MKGRTMDITGIITITNYLTVINQVQTNQSRVIFPPEKDNEAGTSSASPL